MTGYDGSGYGTGQTSGASGSQGRNGQSNLFTDASKPQSAAETGHTVLLGVCGLFLIMLWIFMFICLLIVIGDINTMLRTGFSTSAIGISSFAFFGFLVALVELIPPFRELMYKERWIYPFTTVFMMDYLWFAIPEIILTKGFHTLGEPRHTLVIIAAAAAFVLYRVLECWYLCRRPFVPVPKPGRGRSDAASSSEEGAAAGGAK